PPRSCPPSPALAAARGNRCAVSPRERASLAGRIRVPAPPPFSPAPAAARAHLNVRLVPGQVLTAAPVCLLTGRLLDRKTKFRPKLGWDYSESAGSRSDRWSPFRSSRGRIPLELANAKNAQVS